MTWEPAGLGPRKLTWKAAKLKKTVITLRNPLPGANVMDHLDFAIHYGLNKAHNLSVTAVKNILNELGIDVEEMEKLSICGNPSSFLFFRESKLKT